MSRISNRVVDLFLAALVLYVLLLVFAGAAQAKATYGTVVTPSAGGFNVKFAKDGTPLAVPTNGAGGVVVSTPAPVNLSPVTAIQMVATAGITGAQMAGPWGAAIGTLGAVAVFAIPAFQGAYSAAKLRVKPDGTIEHGESTVPCLAADPAPLTASEISNYQGANWTPAQLQTKNGPDIGGSTGWPAMTASQCAKRYRTHNNPGNYDFTIKSTIGSVGTAMDVWSPVSSSVAAGYVSSQPPTVAQVDALADLGFQPETGPLTLTGPAEAFASNTVKLGLDGSQQTETCKFYIEYFPSNIKAHPECTTTTVTPAKTTTRQETVIGPDGQPVLDGNGNPLMKTVTTVTPATTVTETTTKDKLPDAQACGLPGTPACKMDETGTPAPLPDTQYSTKLDPLKADQEAHVAKVGGTADKPLFPGWSSLFVTPPLAACVPYELPVRNGVSMGSIDPCPVVDGVRSVMAYLWALGGFWLCLGWIKEVI